MSLYLDYASTTPVASEVLQAMLPYFTKNFGNPSNVLTNKGLFVNIAVNKARQIIADRINASKEQIIFTSGATESNNLAILGVLNRLPKNKNHLITSEIEHASIKLLFAHLATKGFEITFIKPQATGDILLQQIQQAIKPSTSLISIMHANNETGVIMPIEEISSLARRNKILFHTDAAQTLDKINIDVQKLKVDLISLSSHKIYGPKGCGALFVSNDLMNHMSPIIYGGGQENNLRSGTLNVPAIVGFGKAVELINFNGHLRTYRDTFENQLKDKLAVKINGSACNRINNISNITFNHLSNSSYKINVLRRSIECSTGASCLAHKVNSKSYVLESMGLSNHEIDASIRFSLGKYTTLEDLHKAAEIIIRIFSN